MTSSYRHRPRRRLAAAAVLALAAVLPAACGSGGGAEAAAGGADAGPPVPGGRLKLAFWADPLGCIDPNQAFWIETRSIVRNVADSLTDQDPETGDIKPWLATSWTVNADASEFTFKLRDGVTFSDGTPFGATSVKTAFDAVHALGAKSTLGLSYLARYDSTTVVDPHTVTVKFTGPNAQFLQATSTTTLSILSPATYAKTPEQRCAGDIVASGLFTLDSYTAGKEAHVTRRPGYAWPSGLVANQGESYLDGIDISYIAEDSVRVGSLTSGAIDVAWPRQPITSADQEVIKASGGVVETRALPGIIGAILPNITGGRPLGDPKVRQALYKAIDLGSYASTVFWDGYPVAKAPFTSTTPFAADLSAQLAHDPDGAAKLLDEAGWAVGSDGYRSKDGKKLSLTLISSAPTPGDQLLQDQLKQVGIELVLNVVTVAQLNQLNEAGQYDLTPTYLTRADPAVLGSLLDQSVSKSFAGRYSEGPATATRISELFAAGLSSVDPAARESAYRNLQEYLIEQGVVYPIYDRLQVVGLSSKVHGFAWTSESFLRANDIWLSK